MKTHYKLGTRRSLLAWTQSSWVAQEIIKRNQALGKTLTVELVGIETKGDVVLDKPLSEIEGKEFFTAELDRALLNGEVDFTVHSMKDLSTERPSALMMAAVPPRELQHDILVLQKSALERIHAQLPVRIGTSSPRRLHLTPAFLSTALPNATFKFLNLRGNVNTRLSRLHEPVTSDRKLDGVILAFAGLERLADSNELASLLTNTRFMVLPLTECPTAPAQGALGVECQLTATETQTILRVLHCEKTMSAVKKERAILQEWGGGCHQKLGASIMGDTLLIKGQKLSGEKVSETRSEHGTTISNYTQFLPAPYVNVDTADLFDFVPYSPNTTERKRLSQADAVFVAHARAVTFLPKELFTELSQKRIWVSGTKTWEKLAQMGLTVEGCTEGLGIKHLETFLNKKLLNVPAPLKNAKWVLLTHAESLSMNPSFGFEISVVPTYSHQFKKIPAYLFQGTHFFWNSGLAFQTVLEKLSGIEKESFLKKSHACGPGRTLMVLRKFNVTPAFVTGQEN